jgi:4-oxalocrotonate tautomerase
VLELSIHHNTIRSNTMPLVQIKGISGFLSLQQKQEIISKVTDAIVSVEGEGLRPVTWVIIEDVASGEWGVGGQAVTTDAIRAMSQQSG